MTSEQISWAKGKANSAYVDRVLGVGDGQQGVRHLSRKSQITVAISSHTTGNRADRQPTPEHDTDLGLPER
jgi:hypothetical protein